MKSAWVAAGIGGLLFGVPTLAAAGEKVDMAELTCQQFLADEDGILPTVVWIDGYLSHQSGNTVIDMDQLVANVKQIADQCAGEPDKKIMELVPEDE
ncbi:HdeA/HdeB family chaperone [Pleomorphomonas koreensis]|uniref:HdeA/HdeB family chaperone n=1 Tax=Pleomorphomonas koreensis TaxID=257440 RepID=UPI00047C8766|nr:HdeA/HdeB family chaperone [Pleomorphomonas koreensis]